MSFQEHSVSNDTSQHMLFAKWRLLYFFPSFNYFRSRPGSLIAANTNKDIVGVENCINFIIYVGKLDVTLRVHTTPEEFEKAALFLRLDVTSALIRHEHGAFQKRSSNRRNLKTPALRFRVDGNHFENGAFRKL